MKLDCGPPVPGQGSHESDGIQAVPPVKNNSPDEGSARLQIHQAHPEGSERQLLSPDTQDGGTQDGGTRPRTSRLQATPDFQTSDSHGDKRGRLQPGNGQHEPKEISTSGSNAARRAPASRLAMTLAEQKAEISIRLRSEPQQTARTQHQQMKQGPGLATHQQTPSQHQAHLDLLSDMQPASAPSGSKRQLTYGPGAEGEKTRFPAQFTTVAMGRTHEMAARHLPQLSKQEPTGGQSPAKRPPEKHLALYQQPAFQQEPSVQRQREPLSKSAARGEDKLAAVSNHEAKASLPPERPSALYRTLVEHSIAESSTRLAIFHDQMNAEQKHTISPVARLMTIFDAWMPFGRNRTSRHARRVKDTTDKEPAVNEGYIMWSGVFDFWRVRPVTYKHTCKRPGGCVLKINDSSFCDKCIKPEL